jgi:hypothetical protein
MQVNFKNFLSIVYTFLADTQEGATEHICYATFLKCVTHYDTFKIEDFAKVSWALRGSQKYIPKQAYIFATEKFFCIPA